MGTASATQRRSRRWLVEEGWELGVGRRQRARERVLPGRDRMEFPSRVFPLTPPLSRSLTPSFSPFLAFSRPLSLISNPSQTRASIRDSRRCGNSSRQPVARRTLHDVARECCLADRDKWWWRRRRRRDANPRQSILVHVVTCHRPETPTLGDLARPITRSLLAGIHRYLRSWRLIVFAQQTARSHSCRCESIGIDRKILRFWNTLIVREDLVM